MAADQRPTIGQCMNPVCVAWLYAGAALVKTSPGGKLMACSPECAAEVDRLVQIESEASA